MPRTLDFKSLVEAHSRLLVVRLPYDHFALPTTSQPLDRMACNDVERGASVREIVNLPAVGPWRLLALEALKRMRFWRVAPSFLLRTDGERLHDNEPKLIESKVGVPA